MAPSAAVLKGVEMMIKKVAHSAIGKRSRGGRRLESQRVKGFMKDGLDKLKKSVGVKKMALFKLLAGGAAHQYPGGFRVEFRPNCSCHIMENGTVKPEEEEEEEEGRVSQRNVKNETV